MGYYIAILRAKDTSSAQQYPITREEWLAIVRETPDMRILPAGPMPMSWAPNFQIKQEGDFVVWTGAPEVNSKGEVWFHYSKDGFIDVKYPGQKVLRKMYEIAG